MKGYVVVPQFWYYAKTWDELVLMAPKGDAATYAAVVAPLQLRLLQIEPTPGFGQIVFRVEDDGKLTQMSACYDSSG